MPTLPGQLDPTSSNKKTLEAPYPKLRNHRPKTVSLSMQKEYTKHSRGQAFQSLQERHEERSPTLDAQRLGEALKGNFLCHKGLKYR